MPVLFEERNQKVDREHHVGNKFIFGHIDGANSNTETRGFFILELDGGFGFGNFLGKVVQVRDGGGKFTSLVQTRTEELGNLLDHRVRSEKSIKRLCELFDFFLVLVHLFQVIHGAERNVGSFGLVTMESITKNANGHFGTRHIGQFDVTTETLVTSRVVVLKTELKLNGFGKVALVFRVLRVSQKTSNGNTNRSGREFAMKPE